MTTFLANQAVDMEALPELALLASATVPLNTPTMRVAKNGDYFFVIAVDTANNVNTLSVVHSGKTLYQLTDSTTSFTFFTDPYDFLKVALAGNDDVIGSHFDDNLVALGGNDALHGRRGADTLAGGLGADFMTGGDDEDKFVFDTALGAGNIDTLPDFARKEGDRIVLDHLVFTELDFLGVLKGKAFNIGKKAGDKNDRIVFNENKATLSYDEDGKGGAKQIKFAVLDKGTDLAAGDILVI